MISKNDYIYKSHRKFYKKLNTLVFVNTPLVGVNTYLEYCKYTNQVVSFLDVVNNPSGFSLTLYRRGYNADGTL